MTKQANDDLIVITRKKLIELMNLQCRLFAAKRNWSLCKTAVVSATFMGLFAAKRNWSL